MGLIQNLIYGLLIEEALKLISPRSTLFYLNENLPWERSLVFHARKRQHERILGSAALNLRFWDLRYFRSPAAWQDGARYGYIDPDFFLVNGPAAHSFLTESGCPNETLKDVEALRYITLDDSNEGKTLRTKNYKPYSVVRKAALQQVNIVICMDYQKEMTKQFLNIVFKMIEKLPSNYSFFLKPHPAAPVRLTGNTKHRIELVDTKLSVLLKQADAVVCSNHTSSSIIEVLMSKVPAIAFELKGELNMSPIYGLETHHIKFVSNEDELVETINQNTGMVFIGDFEYFNVDATFTALETFN